MSQNKTTKGVIPNCYVRKEMRTHLGDLSKLAFGSRGKWKKLAMLHGITVDSIIEQMEALIEYKLTKIADDKKKKTGGRE